MIAVYYVDDVSEVRGIEEGWLVGMNVPELGRSGWIVGVAVVVMYSLSFVRRGARH